MNYNFIEKEWSDLDEIKRFNKKTNIFFYNVNVFNLDKKLLCKSKNSKNIEKYGDYYVIKIEPIIKLIGGIAYPYLKITICEYDI